MLVVVIAVAVAVVASLPLPLPSPCARSRFLAACVLPLPAAAFLAACVLPLPAAALLLFHVCVCHVVFFMHILCRSIDGKSNCGVKMARGPHRRLRWLWLFIVG